MSAEKFRVVIYTNTCEKKVICIPATEDINIAIMPFQTADNALIIVCQNTRIIRRTELMNPLMILVKIIKLRWIHILSYDQMV
ncbi:PilI type IV pilus biogenesis protein, partial [Escherichia coli]